MAERADREKPMNIESDALRYDDVKQISVFTGKVVLTKGTMLIRGARLDVRQDADGNQFGVVTAEPGKLAFFRQKRDTRADASGRIHGRRGRTDRVRRQGRYREVLAPRHPAPLHRLPRSTTKSPAR